MSGFLSRLNHERRAQIAAQAVVAQPPPAPNPATPATPDLLAGFPGAAPAKKAQGLSGAALRRTVADVFETGKRLGIPVRLLARYAAAIDKNLAPMRALADQILDRKDAMEPGARARVESLPGRLLSAIAPGLAALDATSGGNAIRQTLETIAETIAAREPSAAEVRALESLARSIAQLGGADIGGELKDAAARIRGEGDWHVVQAAVRAIEEEMPRLVAAAEPAQRAMMLTVVLDAGLSAGRDPNAAVDAIANAAIQNAGTVLTDGQHVIVQEVANRARQVLAERIANDQQIELQIVQLSEQYRLDNEGAHRAVLAPLDETHGRVLAELPPEAQQVWYAQVHANLGAGEAAVRAIGEILFEMLAHAGQNGVPNDAAQAIAAQIIQLSQAPGVTADALVALAKEHVRSQPAERIPGTLAILQNIFVQLAAQGVPVQNPHHLVDLANALVGRTEELADQDRVAILVELLKNAPSDAAFSSGPRIAQAVHAMEPGPARDRVLQLLANDLATVGEFDAVASAYATLPEDSILRFCAMGAQRGIPADDWLLRLQDAFKNARANKEHIRTLRSLIILADQAGADVGRLLDALKSAGMSPQMYMRTVHAIMNENNQVISADQVAHASEVLERKENLASEIETKLSAQMVKQLGLDAILQDAAVHVTPQGFALIQGPLNSFFAQGVTNPQLDKAMFKDLLVAVLEDRFDAFRFTRPATDAQLACLSAEARKTWEEGTTMTHVRFDQNGEAEFEKRIATAAKIGGALLERMTRAWGAYEALVQKRDATVAELRNVDKNDRETRKRLLAEMEAIPAKIAAFEGAKALAELTPETTTPLQFSSLADMLPNLGRLLGESAEPALNELAWTLRIDDLSYTQVVTHDRLDLAAMYRGVAIGTGCLNHWPQKIDFLAYCVDANKRMIMVKNQAGQERRAVMRLVERQDDGHVGEPMLLLERTYPDQATEEEKRLIIEHMLRRATEMGIAACYATEYYKGAQTARRIADLDKVLEDLNRRYHTTSSTEWLWVLNRAGNMPQEYLDSAPKGRQMVGKVGERYYPGNVDTKFENEFVILEPKKIG